MTEGYLLETSKTVKFMTNPAESTRPRIREIHRHAQDIIDDPTMLNMSVMSGAEKNAWYIPQFHFLKQGT